MKNLMSTIRIFTSSRIRHSITFSLVFLSYINCNSSKCFETYKDGPLTVFKFENTSLIDKVLISDEYLIVTGLNDIYLIQQYNLTNCLSKDHFYNETRPGLELLNRNKILLDIDKDLKKFLVCNTMTHEGCSIFTIEHGQLQVIKKSFNFNANFQLKYCLITKLSHDKNLMISCDLNKKKQNNLIIGKMRFDEEKQNFQIVEFGDQRSIVSLDNREVENIKIDLVYDFDQLMVGSRDRFYYANILKREQNGSQNLVSKLGRVCLNDHSFRSYTEMYLSCQDPKTGLIYKYAQSAQLGHAYSLLHKDTLYVTFNSYNDQLNSVDESKGTVLCAFDSEKIDKFYSEAIRKCNIGNLTENASVRLMNRYSANRPNKRCAKTAEKFDEKQLNCPMNPKNAYIDYREEMEGEYLYKFENEIVSSVSTFLMRNELEIKRGVVLVTNRGKIYRLAREESSMRLEHEFQMNHKVVLKQIESFVGKESVFFTIGHFMIKYPLNLMNETLKGDHVPKHESRRKSSKHKSKVLKTSVSVNFGLYFILCTLFFSISIAILICVTYKQFRTTKTPPIEFAKDQEKVLLRARSSFLEKTEEMLAKNNILIHESNLQTFEKIGSGFFGQVYRGQLNIPSKPSLEVAIKTLNDLSTGNYEIKNASKSLIDEAFIMKDFKHENILTLVGVCIQEYSMPKIVLPFMSKGSLISYIRSEQNMLTIRKLLQFAIDVGEGMRYLSELKFCHRDLAARNCMLDENLIVKIGDFGLTRDVYERNYYISNTKSGLPIKWMAPECIEKCVVTTESDVWSYGVLLWELMTRGNIPYAALENYRVIDYLNNSNRLAKPATCFIEIYELMLDCWQLIPRFRPTFDDIVRRIRALILEKEIELETQSTLMVNYSNFPVEQYYSAKRNEQKHISFLSSGYLSDLYTEAQENDTSQIQSIEDLNNAIEMPRQKI